MRVLFCSAGAAGHLLPMVPLAAALLRAGHRVGWAAARDALPFLTLEGMERFAVGLDVQAARRVYRARWPEAATLQGRALSAHTFPRLFGGVMATAMLDDLGVVIDRWHPDLVIHEPGALAAPLACHGRQIRHVTHAFGLRLPPAHLAAAVHAFSGAWRKAGLRPPEDGGLYRHLYLDIVPPGLQGTAPAGAPGTVQALSPSTDRVPRRQPLPPALARTLGRARGPVLYLSFGTVFNRAPALRMAAQALARLDATVVVTLGQGADVSQWQPSPPNVHLAPYLDQPALLPFCDAVVSHGGAGTMLGALASGLPQLVLPQAADQFRNARALAAAGAGICLMPEDGSADRIEHATREVLRTTGPVASARRLAAEIAAMPSADEVAAWLAGT